MSVKMVKDYYMKNKEKLMVQFDKLLHISKELLLKHFTEKELEEMFKQMRNEYEKIIPEIPYIGGRKNSFTSLLVDTITIVPFFRILENKDLTYREIGEFTYEFWEEIFKRRVHKFEKTGQTPVDQFFNDTFLNFNKILAKSSQLKKYPDDFVMEFLEGDGKTFDYGYTFTECGVNKFFKKLGIEKYTPFMCLSDFVQANIYGFGFTRTQTIGNGAPICDHRFLKNSTTPRAWPPDKLQEFKMNYLLDISEENSSTSEKKREAATNNLRLMFDAVFKFKRSQSFRDIFREVYGDDYPEQANPLSFVTNTDLLSIVEHINVGPGKTFIDLGCGSGGPGLWIAQQTGANYLGIDFSQNALEKANQRISEFELNGTAKFQLGDITALELPENSFDGAISLDVISFIPDTSAAISEIARILRPNAYFIFTSWENKMSKRISDFSPYLRNSGFKINTYRETPDWERRQREIYQKILELKDVLIKDMGREGTMPWIMEAKGLLPVLNNFRRILAIAMKI
jgi:ubiquinone/menaquinone biosynthesis C-methylase UbiE